MAMTAQTIVERIMSDHWDMKSCDCWVCHNGRALGFAPRVELLSHRNGNSKFTFVPSGWDMDQFLERTTASEASAEERMQQGNP